MNTVINFLVQLIQAGKEEVALGKKKLFLDSKIISQNSNYEQQLMTWLKEVNSTSYPKILYHASCDGWSTKSFHSCCDDYNHTLVVVAPNEGYVFGGHSSDQSWGGHSGYK